MTDLPAPVAGWLAEHGEELVAVRRHLHAHPERSWEEFATTRFLAERLELAGLAPRVLSLGTGLICDIDPPNGTPGEAVALRGDIDALAMDDEKDVHYRSQTPGVAHACGHDVHTAIVLGAGLYFAHHRDELPGRVRLIFQPAEESVPGGAVSVIDEGAISGVGAILGLHCDPKLDVGLIGLRTGAITSTSDRIEIRLAGPGGHTARPEQTVDMVRAASEIVCDLPKMVAERLDAPVKVVFGSLHSGDAGNVIPAHARLRGTVRTPSVETWEAVQGVIEAAVAELVGAHGAGHELDYVKGIPPVVNHAAITATVRQAAADELGGAAITEAMQSWGGDDFAWYLQRVPGTFVRLGVHDPATDGPRLDLHAGHFDVDERAIGVGVRLLVAATRAALLDRRASGARRPGAKVPPARAPFPFAGGRDRS